MQIRISLLVPLLAIGCALAGFAATAPAPSQATAVSPATNTAVPAPAAAVPAAATQGANQIAALLQADNMSRLGKPLLITNPGCVAGCQQTETNCLALCAPNDEPCTFTCKDDYFCCRDLCEGDLCP